MMIYSPSMGVAILGNIINPLTIAQIKLRIPEDSITGLRLVVSCLTEGTGSVEQMEDVGDLMDLYGKARRAGISFEELSQYVDKLTGGSSNKPAAPIKKAHIAVLPEKKTAPAVLKLSDIKLTSNEKRKARAEFRRLKGLKNGYATIATRLAKLFPQLANLDGPGCKEYFKA